MNHFQILVTIFTFISLVPSSSHAMSFAPCSNERIELKESTPISAVGEASAYAALVSSFGIIFEHGPPGTRSDSLKEGIGFGTLGLNYLFAFGLGGCNPSKNSFDEAPLSEEERSKIREGYIKGTYIIGGIDTALFISIFFIAEHPTNRILAGLAIPVPLVTALFNLDKFKTGPALEHRNKTQTETSVGLFPDGNSLAPGIVSSIHF